MLCPMRVERCCELIGEGFWERGEELLGGSFATAKKRGTPQSEKPCAQALEMYGTNLKSDVFHWKFPA